MRLYVHVCALVMAEWPIMMVFSLNRQSSHPPTYTAMRARVCVHEMFTHRHITSKSTDIHTRVEASVRAITEQQHRHQPKAQNWKGQTHRETI